MLTLNITAPTAAKADLLPLLELQDEQKVQLVPGQSFKIPGYGMKSGHLELPVFLWEEHWKLNRSDGNWIEIEATTDAIAKFSPAQSSKLPPNAQISCPKGTRIQVPRVFSDRGHYKFRIYLWHEHCHTDKVVIASKDDAIALIIQECREQGVTDKRQIAYILATVEHETNKTFEPVREAYWLDAKYGFERAEEIRRTNRIIGRYFPHYGRGYVQLTWDYNYAKYAELTGRDLVNHLDLAMEPDIAAFVLVHGMKTGGFTGKRLDQYINGSRCDFRRARKIVNGMDRARDIAAIARKWLTKVDEYL